ncbi:MAG: ATP synthase subunit C family protein [Alphaproteobacteria bacterium]
MDVAAAKMLGAGLAMIACLGVGIGLGNIFSKLVEAIARNPSAKKDILPVGLIGAALTESIALLALLVAFYIISQ